MASPRGRAAALALLALLALAAGGSQGPDAYERLPSRKGDRCIVCGTRIDDRGLSILYRGRRVPLADDRMLSEFVERPDDYFHKLEPRSALFQEDSILGSGIRAGWLVFGAWVLTSLLTGAFASGLALRKGLSGVRWYFIGLATNLLGVLLLLGARSAAPVKLPPGLAKLPATAQPDRCPTCGAEHHPSARECARCGAALTPRAASDVDRLRTG